MNKTIAWFEIPATDLDRAQTFYQTILAAELTRGQMAGTDLAVFPYDRANATGGALLASTELKPAAGGTIVYLNAGESIDAVIERIPQAGGSILLPKTELPNGIGMIAQFLDSEGNRVGLHAMK